MAIVRYHKMSYSIVHRAFISTAAKVGIHHRRWASDHKPLLPKRIFTFGVKLWRTGKSSFHVLKRAAGATDR